MSRAGAIALALALVGAALVVPGSVAAADGTQIASDGDDLTLEAGVNQTISGQTELEAGTTVLVRLQSQPNQSSPFIRQQTATVGEDGAFAAQFDMSATEPGTDFNATVRYDGQEIARTVGTVVPCESGCEAASESGDDSGEHGTTLDYEGETIGLAAAPGQAVAGQTDLEPGTALTIRLRSSDPQAPFLRQRSATVQEDGSFSTPVDLGQVPVDTEFELTVLSSGETLYETGGTVVECSGSCAEATATPTDSGAGTAQAGSVDTDSVAISAIAEGSAGQTVPIEVSVGDRETVSIALGGADVNYRLNATVRDGDGDRRVRLQFHTGAVGASAQTLTAADDADSVTVVHESDLNADRLDPAPYDAAVYASEIPTGEPAGIGSVVLHGSPDDETDDTEPTQSAADENWRSEFGFRETIVTARAGQQTTLQIAMNGTRTATVSIGSPESGVELNATVEDGNGDGTVGLLLDTTAVGDSEQPSLQTTQSADTVVVTTERADAELSAGEYDLGIYRGEDTSGQPDDIGTLSLQEPLTNDTDTTPPATPETTDSEGTSSAFLGGGALAVGGILAIAGLGLVLGLFRD